MPLSPSSPSWAPLVLFFGANLPAAARTQDPLSMLGRVAVRQIGGKGKGIVATEDLAAGSLVLLSPALAGKHLVVFVHSLSVFYH